VHGPHIATQRDPGLAAKRAQPANCTSSASIKHGHVLGSFFFPLFPSSILSGKNSLGQQTQNFNATCLTKADTAFWTGGNSCREQKGNLLCFGHSYCDLKPNCQKTKKEMTKMPDKQREYQLFQLDPNFRGCIIPPKTRHRSVNVKPQDAPP